MKQLEGILMKRDPGMTAVDQVQRIIIQKLLHEELSLEDEIDRASDGSDTLKITQTADSLALNQ